MFFLSRRFSRLRSATTSFSANASARRSFTSPGFAWRAVSPASRFLPASRNSPYGECTHSPTGQRFDQL